MYTFARLQGRAAFGPRDGNRTLDTEDLPMRKKTLAAALTGALALSMTGAAYADINNSTFELSKFSASPAKSGTKKKPKAVKLSLGVKGGTKDGTGQASTSTVLKISLPKGLNWNGKAWAKSKRCSVSAVNKKKSDSPCPKGSKIGKGHVDATALGTPEAIDVTAYVTTGGGLGLFLKASQPLPISEMIEGKVKGRVINVAIPTNIQEPVVGVPSAIETLSFSLNGKTKVKGKSRGVVESTSCSGKWTLKFDNIVTDGKLSDSRSVSCKK
jgi:hypothetical protein